MRKLKLKALELGATGLLTRRQLKNVMGMGGYGSGSECPDGQFCQQTVPCFLNGVCINGRCVQGGLGCP